MRNRYRRGVRSKPKQIQLLIHYIQNKETAVLIHEQVDRRNNTIAQLKFYIYMSLGVFLWFKVDGLTVNDAGVLMRNTFKVRVLEGLMGRQPCLGVQCQ